VVGYHNSSIAKALADLFPDIGIDKAKFIYQQSTWERMGEGRKRVRGNYLPLLFKIKLFFVWRTENVRE
jgi:hypothetical protein